MSVRNLTNTTWKLKNNWTAEAGYGQFNIDCSIDGGDMWHYLAIGYTLEIISSAYVVSANCISYGEIDVPQGSISQGSASSIVITGGADVENAYLIAWLYENGELVEPEEQTLPIWSTCELQMLKLPTEDYTVSVKICTPGYVESPYSDSVLYNKMVYFFIEGVTYKASPNMTWNEWINSDYNTDALFNIFADSYVSSAAISSKNVIVNEQATRVLASDTIADSESYSISILPALNQPEIALEGTTLHIYDPAELVSNVELYCDSTLVQTIPVLINFNIGNVYYEAPAGITWKEWVTTPYNTGGYSNQISGVIFTTDPTTSWIHRIEEGDVIIPNREYTLINYKDIFGIGD